MRVGPAGSTTSTPLDIAADAGLLFDSERLTGQHSLSGSTQIGARQRHSSARTAGIETTAIDQPARGVEQEKVRRASRLIGAGNRLACIVEIGKGVAEACYLLGWPSSPDCRPDNSLHHWH